MGRRRGARLISKGRPEIAADRPRNRYQPQVEATDRDQIAAERHDDFRRQRDAGAFESHQADDADISGRSDRGDDPAR
jgi:hypothetical protein